MEKNKYKNKNKNRRMMEKIRGGGSYAGVE